MSVSSSGSRSTFLGYDRQLLNSKPQNFDEWTDPKNPTRKGERPAIFKHLLTRAEGCEKEFELFILRKKTKSPNAEYFRSYLERLLKENIFPLINSNSSQERIAGILAIDALIQTGLEYVPSILPNYISICLKSNDVELIQLAIKALGHMAERGRSNMVTLALSFQMKKAFEWLQDKKSELRKCVGCLVLISIAENSPILFTDFMSSFIDLIWIPLHDFKANIRELGVQALRACLVALNRRDSHFNVVWYERIIDRISKGLTSTNEFMLHGALVAFGELLSNSGNFLTVRYRELSDIALKYRDHKSPLIRKTVIELIPQLAAFNPEMFVEHYLTLCVDKILLKRENLSPSSFISLGKVALVVKGNMKPYLERSLEALKFGLSKNFNGGQFCPEVLTSTGMLARSVSSSVMQEHMPQLIEFMFAGGLNSVLINSLRDIEKFEPKSAGSRLIRERLLDSLSMILAGEPFSNPGAPRYGLSQAHSTQQLFPSQHHFGQSAARSTSGSHLSSSNSSSSSFSSNSSHSGTHTAHPSSASTASGLHRVVPDATTLSLALQTLGTFNFEGFLLSDLLTGPVVSLLHHPVASVRHEAIQCASRLLRACQAVMPGQEFGHLANFIVEKLVIAAVVDEDPRLRKEILSTWDSEAFDPYLAQETCLRFLVMGLNDHENFAVALKTLQICCRVLPRNPAFLLPRLRVSLKDFVGELERTTNPRLHEESAQLLSLLIPAIPANLIGLHAAKILELLLPILESSVLNSPLYCAVLEAFGELAAAAPACFTAQNRRTLMNHIMSILTKEQFSPKRQVALATLGKLCRHTNYVILPLLEFPKLLQVIANDPNPYLRREVIKVIGIIGALDPYKYQIRQLQLQGLDEEKDNDRTEKYTEAEDLEKVLDSIQLTPDYTTTFTIKILLTILDDRSLSSHHRTAVSTVMVIAKNLGPQLPQFLPLIIPNFLTAMQGSPEFRNLLFQQMGQLVIKVKRAIRPWIDDLLRTIHRYWDNTFPRAAMITLIERLSLELTDEFSNSFNQLLPKLLEGLEDFESNPSDSDTGTSLTRLLHALENFGVNLAPHMNLALPPLCALILVDKTPAVQLQAIRTLAALVSQFECAQYASTLFHAVARLLARCAAAAPLVARSASGTVPRDATRTQDHLLQGSDKEKEQQMFSSRSFSATHQAELDRATLHLMLVLIKKLRGLYVPFRALCEKAMPRHLLGAPAYVAAVRELNRDLGLYRPATLSNGLANHGSYAQNGVSTAHTSFDPYSSSVFGPSTNTNNNNHHNNNGLNNTNNSSNNNNNHQNNATGGSLDTSVREEEMDQSTDVPSISKLGFNEFNLKEAWKVSKKATKEDWIQWLRKFTIALIKESPSPAIRALLGLASDYHQIREDIFNIAFATCWSELSEPFRVDLVGSLEIALRSITFPNDQVQALLNLCEFMDQHEQGIGLDKVLLGDLALRVHTFAKALHYHERAFKPPSTASLEALFTINNHLQLSESAHGLLTWAQKEFGIVAKETWHEALNEWDMALRLYERREQQEGSTLETVLGKLRCYHALVDWDKLYQLAQQTTATLIESPTAQPKSPLHARQNGPTPSAVASPTNAVPPPPPSANGPAVSPTSQHHAVPTKKSTLTPLLFADNSPAATLSTVAGFAIPACWHLQKWDDMHKYVGLLPETSLEARFYRAVLAFHHHEYATGRLHIGLARDQLDSQLRSLLSESYPRVYSTVVKAQQLAELEEVILYKQAAHPTTQKSLRQIWDERARHSAKDLESWQSMLAVRALVLSPIENRQAMIKFAKLCRQAGRFDLSEKTLMRLLDVKRDSGTTSDILNRGSTNLSNLANTNNNHTGNSSTLTLTTQYPDVTFAYLQHTWAYRVEGKAAAFRQLQLILPLLDKSSRLYSKVCKTLGTWNIMLEGINERTISAILHYFQNAIEADPTSYKAWHMSAYSHYEAINYYAEKAKRGLQNHENIEAITRRENEHLVPALKGFFMTISFTTVDPHLVFKDILRLLKLWWRYGSDPKVEATLRENFKRVSIETWLPVIPQLIARINAASSTIRQLILELLQDIGRAHPQALVPSVLVALKSQVPSRAQVAKDLLAQIRAHSGGLVADTMLLSDELIRVSILWEEMWHEGLGEASKAYFDDHNIPAMFDVLRELHDIVQKPATPHEEQFIKTNSRDYMEALECCRRWEHRHRNLDLDQAWQFYGELFRRLHKRLPKFRVVDLRQCSPNLHKIAAPLHCAVPGSYQVGKEVVTVSGFTSEWEILTTKQRPRKIVIRGSDGANYMMLLKGHEDLRQDERAMQLFGLVNTLLASEYTTSRNHLKIGRYSIVPLSPRSGLIGWVPHYDTMHGLIHEYRSAHKIALNYEYRIMTDFAPLFEKLPIPNRVEALLFALEQTDGRDLRNIFWLKSSNSEHWLERRTNFIRSVAVMSMVGYILGLGDRHPSNLMIDRHTGRMLHIDFGDCFEVAMKREKYPEKVPFRLTRMMTSAMEISGSEGTFKSTCHAVMKVLRDNKESLMVVLEAFVYDPILNWRLINPNQAPDTPVQKPKGTHNNTSEFDNNNNISLTSSKESNNNNNNNSNNNNNNPDKTPIQILKEEEVYQLSTASYSSHEDRRYQSEVSDKLSDKIALEIINRVFMKITGREFGDNKTYDIQSQVDILINEATSLENLCHSFLGWCPFW